jgi:hypothetical protein
VAAEQEKDKTATKDTTVSVESTWRLKMDRITTVTRSGWVSFAAVMLAIGAAFDFIWAITAFAKDEYFINRLLFGNLTAWGVLYLIGSALLALTAYLVSRRNAMGQVLGVTLAAVNVVGALLTIGAYPLWSLSIMVVGALVIYGLTAHWDGE